MTNHYRQFVHDGFDATSIWSGLAKQVFLGDDGFVERMQSKLGDERDDIQIPKLQRRAPAPTLAELAERAPNRDTAIVAAHAIGAYSYTEIGAFFGLHFATIGTLLRSVRDSA